MKIAVYTSITADKDALREDQNFEGADFIAYTDFVPLASRWIARRASDVFRDPRRNAKIHKVLAHQYLGDYDYSLWIDGSMRLLVPVQSLIEDYLRDSDIAMFGHHERDCLYEEAAYCSELGLDSAEVITEQVQRYRAAGYPRAMGLHEGPVILRRHTALIEQFNDSWWSEICRSSRRDQISLNYVLHQLQITPARFPGTVLDNPGLFVQELHAHHEDRMESYETATFELIRKTSLRAESLEAQMSQLDGQMSQLSGQVRRLEVILRDRDLEDRTAGYRLLALARAGADVLFPPGSLRGRLYARLLKSM